MSDCKEEKDFVIPERTPKEVLRRGNDCENKKVAFALLLSCLCFAALASREYLFRFHSTKGAKWAVDQTIEVNKTEAGRGESTTSIGSGTVDRQITMALNYTDEVLQSSDSRPATIRRNYDSVKLNGEKEELEGAAVQLTAREGSVGVTVEKGAPDEDALRPLKQGPLDPTMLLLPGKKVKTGATWRVSEENVSRFWQLVTVGFRGIQATARVRTTGESVGEAGATTETTETIDTNSMLDTDHPALQAVLESVDGETAIIRYHGATKTSNQNTVNVGGLTVVGGPTTTTNVDATLRFDLNEGHPTQLDWTEETTLRNAGGIVSTGGIIGGTSEIVTHRSFSRRYGKS